MPIAQQALAGLQSHDPYSRNMISARLEQERQLEDMKRRAALEQENPNFTSGATSADIASSAHSLDESPTFGVEPQRQLAMFNKAQQGAQLAGFSSPQEQSGYEQQQEEQKLRQPLDVARINSQGDVNQAEMTGWQQRQLARERAESPSEVGMGQYYAALAKAAEANAAGGGQPIQSMSKSGMTFAKPGPAIAPAMANQIAEARRKAQGSPFGNMFGVGNSAAQTKLQSLLSAAMANHPAPDDDKAIAQQLLSRPELQQMPVAELVARMQRKGTLRPDQVANIRELLMIMRGEQ